MRELPGLGPTLIAVSPVGTPVAIVGEGETVDGYNSIQIVTAASVRGWSTAEFLILSPPTSRPASRVIRQRRLSAADCRASPGYTVI